MTKRSLSLYALSLLSLSTLAHSVVRSSVVPPKPAKQTPIATPVPKAGGVPQPAKPAADLGGQVIAWWDGFLKNPNSSWKCAALELAQIFKQANRPALAKALELSSTQTDALKVAEDLGKYQDSFPEKFKQHLKPYEDNMAKKLELLTLFDARVKIRNAQCAGTKPAADLGDQIIVWWDSFLKNPNKSWKCAALALAQILKQANRPALAKALELSSTQTDALKVAEDLGKYQDSFPEKFKQHLKPYKDNMAKKLELLTLFGARVKIRNAQC